VRVPARELRPGGGQRVAAGDQRGLGGLEEVGIVAGVLAALPRLAHEADALVSLEEKRPQRGAVRVQVAEAGTGSIEGPEGLGQKRRHQVLEVVLLGEDQLLRPHRRALRPCRRLVGVVRGLHPVEQLVAGEHADAERHRRIGIADEVVLHLDRAHAVKRRLGAAIGDEAAVGAAQVAQVDIDEAVAAQDPVADRRAKPGGREGDERLVAAQRDLLDEVGHAAAIGVEGRHRVGGGRDVVDADLAVGASEGLRRRTGAPGIALGVGDRGRDERGPDQQRRAGLHSAAHSTP